MLGLKDSHEADISLASSAYDERLGEGCDPGFGPAMLAHEHTKQKLLRQKLSLKQSRYSVQQALTGYTVAPNYCLRFG